MVQEVISRHVQHRTGTNIPAVMSAKYQWRVSKTESIKWKRRITGKIYPTHRRQLFLTPFLFSTKEELQATVQELNDLQRQLTELQQDNYQLLEDKNLMFDSLCRQTERLNESKAEIENLKQRLREKEDDTGQYESAVEREQNLLALVKNAQEEREVLLLKQEQLSNELQEAISNNSQQAALIEQLNERIKTLESALDAKNAEHRQLDQELTSVKDQSSGMQIEIDRLTDLLETARTKVCIFFYYLIIYLLARTGKI